MIENIDHVVIFVTDMQASTKFYTEILGLEIEYPSNEYTSIRVDGTTSIGLHIAKDVGGHHSKMATTQVSFGVADIESAFKLLKAKDVVITRDIQEIAPGKFMFNFIDLDGNQLSCYEQRNK